jgi:hypothetical protein
MATNAEVASRNSRHYGRRCDYATDIRGGNSFGVVVAKLADGGFWVGAAATLGFLILIVLPLRLLWVTSRLRKP